MRHLIDPLDLSRPETDRLLSLAEKIIASPGDYAHLCDGKILATLFYEPSTRTRLSFESAMMRLGGKVLGFSSADSSSAAKGESVADTIRMISGYADIAAMRHFKEGAPYVAARYAGIPVINAGDGGHQHPTQTLTDMLTIRRARGKIGGVTIGLCGDLKFGRTVHSLIKSLVRYEDVTFVLISPEELRVPGYILKEVIAPSGHAWQEARRMEEVMPQLDILYMTRVQRERFFNEEDYVRLKDSYILTPEKLALGKKDLAVLHPLPRVNEIAPAVDEDPRALYFQQARNGVFVRMALILTLLGLAPTFWKERCDPCSISTALKTASSSTTSPPAGACGSTSFWSWTAWTPAWPSSKTPAAASSGRRTSSRSRASPTSTWTCWASSTTGPPCASSGAGSWWRKSSPPCRSGW